MKKYVFLFIAVCLFIIFSIGAGFIAPLIFLKWITFSGIIFHQCYLLFQDKKDNKLFNLKFVFIKSISIFLLALFSIPLTDLAKAKNNATVCPYSTIHKSEYYQQAGIQNTFDLKTYLKALKNAAYLQSVKSDSIKYENKYYEYYTIKYDPKEYKKKILIIASVHGDEPAGALSIINLLNDINQDKNDYKSTAIWILCPMNPVGLAFGSRENECGCNLNRDYAESNQTETKCIINNIKTFCPDLIIDLHENNGNWETCLMANTLVSDLFGKRICGKLSEININLADHAFDSHLAIKGWHKRSQYRKWINKMAGLNDLMWYGQNLNIPVITLECDQSLSIQERKSICTNFVNLVIQNMGYLQEN